MADLLDIYLSHSMRRFYLLRERSIMSWKQSLDILWGPPQWDDGYIYYVCNVTSISRGLLEGIFYETQSWELATWSGLLIRPQVVKPRIFENILIFKQIKIWKVTFVGENSQISYFGKIIDNLALYRKYIGKYHFFGARVCETRVLDATRVQWTWVTKDSAAVAQAELDCGHEKC